MTDTRSAFEERAVRKLVVTTFVTMDGVMQAPGGAGEDPSGGFSYEGWLVPHFDDAIGAQMDEWFTGAQDFLLGRTTYEVFYASWPKMISDDQVSQKLNFNKKYVASRTLTSVEWETAELLQGDVGDAVRKLKATDGGELQVHGSGRADPDAAPRGPRRRAPAGRLPRGAGRGQAALRRGDDPADLAADDERHDHHGRPDPELRARRRGRDRHHRPR